MVAMTSGRLVGDRMADLYGIQRVLAASGILIFTGFTITVLSPYIPVTLVGYLLTGFGVSCVVPFVFSLAGKIPMSNPGAALASISSQVTWISYRSSMIDVLRRQAACVFLQS